MKLEVLPETFAICQLGPGEKIPAWALEGSFFSITRTADELSILCLESQVPAGVKKENNWRALRVAGKLDFALTGILASLTRPLADAGISIFALSTFDTDYLLIKAENFTRAIALLRAQ